MGTAEESKLEYIAKMGEALGTQYAAIWQEIAHLHLTWLEFVELFGTKSSRVELLNRAAPNFFRMVQDRLWEAIALHIARLTDPSNSLGRRDKANLTVRNLPGLIDEPKLKAKITRLCDEAFAASAFARDWRNRHIAHRDLDLALGGSATPLPAVSKNDVTKALEAFAAITNVIAAHYLDSTTSYSMIGRINGAEHLLYVMDDGLEAEAERRRRREAGELRDWKRDIRDL